MISQARLRELLHYDPETGVFTWLAPGCSKMKPGDLAGTKHISGYWAMRVEGFAFLRHRLAWFYMTGRWPKDEIDHIDGDRSNDSWRNLREATRSENQQNVPLRKTNSSGVAGVNLHKGSGKWHARIHHNGKRIFIGEFNTLAAAAKARKEAELQYHPFNTGRSYHGSKRTQSNRRGEQRETSDSLPGFPAAS